MCRGLGDGGRPANEEMNLKAAFVKWVAPKGGDVVKLARRDMVIAHHSSFNPGSKQISIGDVFYECHVVIVL